VSVSERKSSFAEIKEAIKDRVDLASVIGKHTKLIKTGTGYKACCPLPGHREKTPSFSIESRKSLYYCYGCNRGGDLFTFLELVEGLSFMEAMKEFAGQLGLEMPAQKPGEQARQAQEKTQNEKGFEVLGRSAQYFHRVLLDKSTPGAQEAWDYLKKRGISDEEIGELGVGWAPESGDALLRKLKGSEYWNVALELGLVRDSRGRPQDFFQDRLIIPIRDFRGRVRAFSGRTLKPVVEFNPKYKNSPESFIFKKKETLYGLDRAMKLINNDKFVCLVEGYFDQWALQRFDIPAVAVMGTALTPEHLKVLERFTKQVVLILDDDRAGIESTKRSLPPLLEAGWDVRVCTGFGGKDPDEWLLDFKGDKEAVKRRLLNSPEALEWWIQTTAAEGRQQNLNRTMLLRAFFDILQMAADSSHKENLVKKIALETGLGVNDVKEALKDNRGVSSHGSMARAAPATPRREAFSPYKDHSRSKNVWDRAAEEALVWWIRHWELLAPKSDRAWGERMALFEGSLAHVLVCSWQETWALEGALPVKVVSQALEDPQIDPLLKQWIFRGLVMPENDAAPETEDNILNSFKELSAPLTRERVHSEIARLEERIRSLPSGDPLTVDLLKKVQELRFSLENRAPLARV
jgi:DNA primase catalytic core